MTPFSLLISGALTMGSFVLRSPAISGGSIRSSIDLPAQSLHPSITTFFVLFVAAKIKKAIWYCGKNILPYILSAMPRSSA